MNYDELYEEFEERLIQAMESIADKVLQLADIDKAHDLNLLESKLIPIVRDWLDQIGLWYLDIWVSVGYFETTEGKGIECEICYGEDEFTPMNCIVLGIDPDGRVWIK